MRDVRKIGRRTWLTRVTGGAIAVWTSLSLSGCSGWAVSIGSTGRQASDPGGDGIRRVPLGQKLSATVQQTRLAGYTIKEIHYDQIGSDRCAWGVEFVWQEDGTKKKTIDIKFPNGDVHTIQYKKKAISRRLRRNMTSSEKAKLRAAFVQACANQNPQKTMSVKVIGRSDSENALGRKDRLMAVLKGFVDGEYLIHDKLKAFEHFKTNSGFTLWMEEMISQPSWRDLSYKNAITAIYKRLIDALRAANRGIEEGIIVTHVQRLTNLTDLPADRGIHFKATADDKNPNPDKKDKKYYDLPLGAYENSYEANNPFLKVLRFGTPDPKSDKTAQAGAAKSAISVFLHELAHAYGVKHSPYPPGFTGPVADSPAPRRGRAYRRSRPSPRP